MGDEMSPRWKGFPNVINAGHHAPEARRIKVELVSDN